MHWVPNDAFVANSGIPVVKLKEYVDVPLLTDKTVKDPVILTVPDAVKCVQLTDDKFDVPPTVNVDVVKLAIVGVASDGNVMS